MSGILISNASLQDECQSNSTAHIGQGCRNPGTSYKSTFRAVYKGPRGKARRAIPSSGGDAASASGAVNVACVKHEKTRLKTRFTKTTLFNARFSPLKNQF
jgi:hypothetical protein